MKIKNIPGHFLVWLSKSKTIKVGIVIQRVLRLECPSEGISQLWTQELLQVSDSAVLLCRAGSLVAAILATDDDSGVNGEITYTISEDDEEGVFFLNPVTGVFNLTRALDYEAQQYYILTVRAEDGGGQATAIRVYFNILDVNDNAPVFGSASYSTSLMENLPPGSTILNLSVTDADHGRSALAFGGLTFSYASIPF